jgi:hypothetical protein
MWSGEFGTGTTIVLNPGKMECSCTEGMDRARTLASNNVPKDRNGNAFDLITASFETYKVLLN